uniref:RING-type domain-containing protein n=1 Tax=Caenorhabditis tropicalis TaxID=1561998 RepID=A0A1I7U7Q8_9PELO
MPAEDEFNTSVLMMNRVAPAIFSGIIALIGRFFGYDSSLEKETGDNIKYVFGCFGLETLLLEAVSLMKKAYMSKNGYTERQKNESNLKLSSLLIIVFYSIPLCISYFIQFETKALLYGGFCFIWFGMLTCRPIFTIKQFSKCHFNGKHEYILCFVIIGLPLTAIAGYSYYSTVGLSEYDRNLQFLLRLGYGLFLASEFAIYWIVSKYGIALDNGVQAVLKEEEVEPESDPSDEEESESNYEDLKCGICFKGYSSNSAKRVPRMMECGHTVCFGCAKKLRKNSAIRCPLCQKYTFKESKDLPKNYTLIGFLDAMKQSEERKKNAV